jgi:hypothetical protein
LKPEDVTGYNVLPEPPETSGNPDYVESPDFLGHVIREGRCINPGCKFALGFISVEPLTEEARAAALAHIRRLRRLDVADRFPAETPWKGVRFDEVDLPCTGAVKFVPREVKWCTTCLKPFEGEKCAVCP